ncbi:Inactive caspase-12, partial [Clarias magur]
GTDLYTFAPDVRVDVIFLYHAQTQIRVRCSTFHGLELGAVFELNVNPKHQKPEDTIYGFVSLLLYRSVCGSKHTR